MIYRDQNELGSRPERSLSMLERLAPRQVIDEGNGRAIPLTFPEGSTGPAILEARREQIQGALQELRASSADQTPLS